MKKWHVLLVGVTVWLTACAPQNTQSTTTSSDATLTSSVSSASTTSEAAEQKQTAPALVAHQVQQSVSNYDVPYLAEQVTIDGTLDESVWNQVGAISGSFGFPWEKTAAPITEFRAYHDQTNLYFSFLVRDDDVVTVANWEAKGEKTVDDEDRVELFFASGAINEPVSYALPPYYAVEIDPLGRVHDYSVTYYRHFDSNFTLEQAQYAGQQVAIGYLVEGRIPLRALAELGVLRDNQLLRVGVFRAEFSKNSAAENGLTMQWISWVDPKTAEPDFHVDSAFGQFRLLDAPAEAVHPE